MKKEDLHLIGVEQELIDRLFLFKKQIKELKNIIDSHKNEVCKYKKDKPEKKDYQLSNGTLSFLQYKKIKLTNEIIDLLESESVMAECNLLYRLNWIKDLQEHVHYLENQKNLKEQKIYSLSKIF
tara:strand:- start:303 stop:677 length:375 start_codon:yes stop_codon:yes gene_type:complete